MADLSAKSPCAGLLPLTIGANTLSEQSAMALTSLTPFKGRQAALSQALEAAHELRFPAPGTVSTSQAGRCIWFSQGQALLMGPQPDGALAQHAAITDQSDAWAVVELSGPGATDILARLVPVDLRCAKFPQGSTARTLLFHMMASVTRTGPDSFLILVFRSMAQTLVHDLQTAMEAVAARG